MKNIKKIDNLSFATMIGYIAAIISFLFGFLISFFIDGGGIDMILYLIIGLPFSYFITFFIFGFIFSMTYNILHKKFPNIFKFNAE